MISRKWTACLLLLLLFTSFKTIAQRSPGHQLFLKNGMVSLPETATDEIVSSYGQQRPGLEGKLLVIIQFGEIPNEAVQLRLKGEGIELLEYIPDNAYTATLAGPIDGKALKKAGVWAVFRPRPVDIVEPLLLSGIVPDHARTVAGKIDVTLSFAKSFTIDEVIRDLKQNGFEVISENLKSYQVLDVRIPEGSIRRLTEFSWVQYISPVAAPAEMLNDKSTASTKANVLASSALLGYNLDGEGVVVGLGDDSNPIVHPDIGKRVISYVPLSNTWHGVHVGGTAAGSGLLNEKYRGYASKSQIVSRSRSQIWEKPSQLVQDYGMVVTSNTYGGYTSCVNFGRYDYGASALDRQAFQYPCLLNVFAAGNSGLKTNCQNLGLPEGFGTVLGNYQSAKNILTVGDTQENGVISTSSSKGPVLDGRIKPEVSAPGSGIVSTMPNNEYQAAWGTSMATPAVTGGAALLYQRYRQLHQQNNPKNALIKALICNGATDRGLPGPDYSYGFGQMNLLRSVTMLDKGHHLNGEVTHLATNIHEIVVPANTAKLKVLIYWNDPAPSELAGGKALVNNLDLAVIRPGNTKILPKFPSLASPTAAAVSGVDSVNNIEQIVLDAPVAGTYAVKVTATRIPQGVQEYFIVYDIIEPSVTVTYPSAGEHLTKGDAVNICWESYGDTLSTFNVAYSLDNGAAWTTVDAAVAADQRQLAWTVPDAATGNAKVRVVRNGTDFTNMTGPFAILEVPLVTLQPVQCEGYIALQWNAVTGASDYEVMLSTGDDMKAIGLTSELKYTLTGLSKDSTYYVSVRARKDQMPGRRSVAIIRKPDNGTCQGAISDNDIALEAVVTPLPTVRLFTKTAYSAEQSITIRIKNLDDQQQTKPFEIGYSLGGEMHWESVNAILPPTANTDYTFQRRVDLASVSEATLLVRVRLSGDPVQRNDSLTVKLRQIPNPKLVLPYLQDVEAVSALDITSSVSGIRGVDAYDFTNVVGNGRLRTAVPPGIGYLSKSAFVLDGMVVLFAVPSRSYLDGTFNLSGYRVQDDEICLSFRHPEGYFNSHYGFNTLQIRGSSSDPWIPVNVQESRYGDVDNGYKLTLTELTPLLRNNGQQFTADFQVRWGNEASGIFPSDGTVIDDIRLFKTRSDVAIVSLDAPSFSLCDSYNPPMVRAFFRNNGSDDCYNVPIKMSLDGNVVDRRLDVIRKDSIAGVGFYYPIEAYQAGKHRVKVWCEKGSDSNSRNDTLEVEFFTTGTISATPYLENFESGDGGWYTAGTNSSWQFGTPGGAGILNAASGRNAWKTNLTGVYNSNEESYLYSPCLDMAYVSSFLSFSAQMDMEECGDDECDMFYVEYHNGYGWNRLGTKNYGVNWYNKGRDWLGFWSGNMASGWRVFTTQLPFLKYLRLRFVFKSNASSNEKGITIDDIHIYSNSGYDIYDGASVPNEFGPTYTPGNDWTHYTIDNRIVASIHPRGQDIGGINLRTFVNEGPLQVSEKQLVLDRNFVVSSSRNFETPVGVRLYIPEANIERLVTATDHPDLSKPTSAYDLAVTKYSGPNQDGDLANNTKDLWDYFAHDKVAKVPYGSGYYLEFETKNFSEFWVAKDYIGTGTPLPVTLVGFVAERTTSGESNVVHLKWSTASEADFSHFVVQVAESAENVKMGLFYDLGKVEGQGISGVRQYSFPDGPATFHATRYYRLKMIDMDGTFTYSSIRSVTFDRIPEWHVFPNPSKGIFRLEPKTEITGPVLIEVIDLNGKTRKTMEFNEALSVLEVNLGSPDLAEGLYIIKVISKEGEKRFKVIKE